MEYWSDDESTVSQHSITPVLQHHAPMIPPKITIETIRAMKARGEKIAALTAYDFPMTKLLDEAGIPLILVGDSLGMVVLGYPDTTHVTMAEMEHHVRAAARAKPRALLGADLPFRSYETVAAAVKNAKKLVAAGAEFVKAEGGREIIEPVRAIVSAASAGSYNPATSCPILPGRAWPASRLVSTTTVKPSST